MATSNNFGAQGYISGKDAVLPLHDSSGTKYEIVASTTKKDIAVIKGGVTTGLSDVAIAEKGASYTVLPTESGKLFAATAAATFTLPAIANVWDGWNAQFYQTANANLVVTAPSGKLIAPNNDAATSVTFSTTDEKIGATCRVVYLATTAKYILELHGDKHTATIA